MLNFLWHFCEESKFEEEWKMGKSSEGGIQIRGIDDGVEYY